MGVVLSGVQGLAGHINVGERLGRGGGGEGGDQRKRDKQVLHNGLL